MCGLVCPVLNLNIFFFYRIWIFLLFKKFDSLIYNFFCYTNGHLLIRFSNSFVAKEMWNLLWVGFFRLKCNFDIIVFIMTFFYQLIWKDIFCKLLKYLLWFRILELHVNIKFSGVKNIKFLANSELKYSDLNFCIG